MEAELTEFMERWSKGRERFSRLCEQTGISRKTGYKWLQRYRAQGWSGLEVRSRRPRSNARQVRPGMAQRVRKVREEHPQWGPKKIRALLLKTSGVVPAASTIGDILKRAGMVQPRGARRRSTVRFWPLGQTVAQRPNHVWTVDYKGPFRTGDGQRCDILTVRDAHSRYVVAAELIAKAGSRQTRQRFEQIFREHGQPELIRVDNGVPFGSAGPAGLSQLSVWWLRLGVGVEYTRPGKPQDNGGHERMHRDLKSAVASPPARNRQQQRQWLERWRRDFNDHRPHEALGMRTPGEVYRTSQRSYQWPRPAWAYPDHYERRLVSATGEIKWQSQSWFIGAAFAGQVVGLARVSAERFEVYFQDQLLGQLWEREPRRFEPRLRAKRPGLINCGSAQTGTPRQCSPLAPAKNSPAGSPACTAVSPFGRALTKAEKQEKKLSPMSSV